MLKGQIFEGKNHHPRTAHTSAHGITQKYKPDTVD